MLAVIVLHCQDYDLFIGGNVLCNIITLCGNEVIYVAKYIIKTST